MKWERRFIGRFVINTRPKYFCLFTALTYLNLRGKTVIRSPGFAHLRLVLRICSCVTEAIPELSFTSQIIPTIYIILLTPTYLLFSYLLQQNFSIVPAKLISILLLHHVFRLNFSIFWTSCVGFPKIWITFGSNSRSFF